LTSSWVSISISNIQQNPYNGKEGRKQDDRLGTHD
jgi:hypothetical protein